MKAEIQQLVGLQKLDTNIRLLQVQLEAIPQRRAEFEKEFEQRAFEFRAIEARRDEALAARARLEADLVQTRSGVERSERNLMSSKNEKDYTAALRELDATRKHISQLETQTLEQMELLEKVEAEIHDSAPEIDKLRGEMKEKLKDFEDQARAQEAQLAAYQKERERLIKSTPKQMLAIYDRIRTRIRGGIAVAEALNNSCSACSMSLRPEVMTKIRRGEELILCDNCNRILYYVPIEQASKAVPVVAS
ncbi:MAG: hypothetical protein H0T92_20695 [Pyrinomonadaceae bacterium]|nr:hypothetical protein [Pyrinomonadaceae bacterium]